MNRLHSSNLARTAASIDEESLLLLRRRYRASQWMRYVIRPIVSGSRGAYPDSRDSHPY